MDLELLVGIFPQVLLDGLILGFMYALIALGYTMVYGVLEFINFAHSEIFMVGAFVGVEILLGAQARRAARAAAAGRWCCSLILVAGMAVSGLLAVTVERVAYRPLRGAPAADPADLRHRRVVLPAGPRPPRRVASGATPSTSSIRPSTPSTSASS